MKKLSLNIKIVIRSDKQRKDRKYPLYYSIRVDRITNRVSTGKWVDACDWDSKNGCLKTNTKANQLLNKLLYDNMNGWWEYMYQIEADGKPVTLTMASNYFNEKHTQTFYQFFENELAIWGINGKVENTLKTYRSTLKALKEFAPKATFGDLTYLFVQQFDIYLSQKRGNSLNGRWGKHKNLRAVIREAIKKDLIKESANPYKKFSIKSTPAKRQPLTTDEVNEIKKLDIPVKNGFLNRVRDIFLLSVYTGLRFGDLMRLSHEHIKLNPDRIEIEMQKTKKSVIIPLLPDAKAIINKYTKHQIKTVSMTIMPKMTNQVINRELKVLISKTTINKNVTFHIARYAFAASLVQSNINPFVLKELMGHSSITQTQTYVKGVQSDLVNSMEKLAGIYENAV